MKDITITIPAEMVRLILDKLNTAPANDVMHGVAPKHAEPNWTDKQKRLIYRICYQRGHTGEDAKRFIRTRIGLTNGRPPTVREASELIDELIGDDRGGHHGAA